jgi:hypothetical protein
MLRSRQKFKNLAVRLAKVTRVVVKGAAHWPVASATGGVIETNRSVVIMEVPSYGNNRFKPHRAEESRS